jgi:hypothetical protein
MSFRKFDVYRKTVDGVTTQTRIGGAVSLVAFIVVAVLLVSEIRDYTSRDLVSRMKVDSALTSSVVNIRFDVVFPDIECSSKFVSVFLCVDVILCAHDIAL